LTAFRSFHLFTFNSLCNILSLFHTLKSFQTGCHYCFCHGPKWLRKRSLCFTLSIWLYSSHKMIISIRNYYCEDNFAWKTSDAFVTQCQNLPFKSLFNKKTPSLMRFCFPYGFPLMFCRLTFSKKLNLKNITILLPIYWAVLLWEILRRYFCWASLHFSLWNFHA